MWKKVLWIVAVCYPVSVVFIMLSNGGEDQTLLGSIPGFVIFLLPLGLIIFELRGGKTTNIWGKLVLIVTYLISFLLLGVGTAGYYSFNTPTPFNLIKGLPLLIILLALFIFAFQRIFKKKS